MTREQVLDVSKELFKMPRYRGDLRLRANLARRMFKLRKEIAENATDVQAIETRTVPEVRIN